MGSALLRKKNNYTFDGVRERVQLVCKSSGDVAPNGLCAGPDLGPFIIVHRLAEIFSHDVANLKIYFEEPRRQSLRLRTAFNLLLPTLPPPNERKKLNLCENLSRFTCHQRWLRDMTLYGLLLPVPAFLRRLIRHVDDELERECLPISRFFSFVPRSYIPGEWTISSRFMTKFIS